MNAVLLHLAILCLGNPASAQAENLTTLDQAYIDVDKGRIEPHDYYRIFNEQPVYIFGRVISEGPNKDGAMNIEYNMSRVPDGLLINVFDTEARALQFGAARNFDRSRLIGLRNGAALLYSTFEERVYFYLNPETQYEKIFVPEEINYLRNLEGGYEVGKIVPKDIGQLNPAKYSPQGLLDSLIAVANLYESVDAFYITEHPQEPTAENGKPNYLLLIETPPDIDQAYARNIIYEAIEPNISSGTFIDFAFVNSDARKELTGDKIAPVFRRE